MHKFISILLFSFVILLPFGNSQIEFTLSTKTTSPGGTVDVDVTVDNFADIVIMQFSVNWDSTVFSYNSIVNVTNVLPQFNLNENFGTPPAAAAVDDGELVVSWSLQSTEPVSIPNGTRLFTIRLNVVGQPCDESIFTLSDHPRLTEVVDEDFEIIDVSVNPGIVDIEGTNCDGGGADCSDTPDVALIVSEETGQMNDNVCVSVTTKNFTEIASVQAGFKWNPAILDYTGAFQSGLTQISVSEGPGAGELRLVWTVPLDAGANSITLDDDSELFTLCYDLVGSGGQSSGIDIVAFQNFEVEISNEFGQEEVTCLQSGSISIGGTGGGDCENTQDVALIVQDIQTQSGTNICIPITTKNFMDIVSVQAGFRWNPAVLDFTGITEKALEETTFNEGPQDGELRFLWLLPISQTDPISLADDTELFDLCFDVIGANGQSSGLGFTNLPFFDVEVVNEDGIGVATCLQNGLITVGEQMGGDELTLIASTESADEGTEVCVNVSVLNFVDIQSAQFNMQWDQTVITYDRVDNFNLPEFGTSNANFISPNKLRISWNPVNPASVDDNTAIFQVCFDAVGDCNTQPTTTIDFISDENIQIEFTDSQNNILPVETVSGAVSIESCEGFFNIISMAQPLCNGQAGGSIIASVTGAPTPVTCVWKDAQGNTISTSTTDCNLVGVVAGTYTVEITDGANNMFTDMVTIGQPDPLVISGTVNHVGCGETGSIDISVTGGTAPYTYSWDSGLGSVEDPQNLSSGVYAVTVTDVNNCVQSMSFTVNDLEEDLILSSFSVQHRTCNNPASINISIEGGCDPFTFTWTGPNGVTLDTEDISGITGGNWSLMITDSSNPSQTVSMNFIVEDRVEELGVGVNEVQDVSCFGAGDGLISITGSGGCSPYTFSWSGPDGFMSANEVISGLQAGDYTLLIMDSANPPSTLETTITIVSSNAMMADGAVQHITNVDGNNGAIDLMVTGGSGTYIYQWTDGTMTEDRTGLMPGDYAVTVSDENNCMATASFTLEWAAIFADSIIATVPEVDCPGDTNGEIDGFPIGGCGGTEIRLNGIPVELPVSGLEPGTYNLTLRDTCGNEVLKVITIGVPDPIIITIVDIDCADVGAENGAAEISVEGGTGQYTFTWSRGTVVDGGLRAVNLSIGEVSVVVEDENGCQAAQQDIIIDDCEGPPLLDCKERSIISPNNDGVNDNFMFDCLENGANQPNELTIYDRWGRLLFSMDNYDNSWMGTDDRGNPLDEGGYMWILVRQNRTTGAAIIERGTLTILRSSF